MPQCVYQKCKTPRAKGHRDMCPEHYQAMLEEIAAEKEFAAYEKKLAAMLDKQAALLAGITR